MPPADTPRRAYDFKPTPKQQEALDLQEQGLSLRQIAATLNIGRSTAQQRIEGGRRWLKNGR